MGAKRWTITLVGLMALPYWGGLPYAVLAFASAICVAAWMTWVDPVPNMALLEMNPAKLVCRGEHQDQMLTRTDLDRVAATTSHTKRAQPPWADWKPPYSAEQKRYIMQMTIRSLDSISKPQDVPDAPNLCRAKLTKIDLAGLDLSNWNLAGAVLEDVNLRGTQLTNANLAHARITGASDCSEASFSGADAQGLHVDGATCVGASFTIANLTDAKFVDGSLDKADFRGAILDRLSLEGVSVRDTQFFSAKVTGMVYSPQLGSLPNLKSLETTVGLHQLRVKQDSVVTAMERARREDRLVMVDRPFSTAGSTAPLRELQVALAKSGVGSPARAVNYSLHVAERRAAGTAEQMFQYAAYEIPSAYGYRPERSLLTVLLLIPFISPLYWAAIVGGKRRHDNTGLWLRRTDRVDTSRSPKPIRLHDRNSKPFPWAVALYVSLLSAFRIGWHNFNVGDWIIRLQRTEYKFEAVGWPRTIMGLQSLLSIYLLVRFLVEYLSI